MSNESSDNFVKTDWVLQECPMNPQTTSWRLVESYKNVQWILRQLREDWLSLTRMSNESSDNFVKTGWVLQDNKRQGMLVSSQGWLKSGFFLEKFCLLYYTWQVEQLYSCPQDSTSSTVANIRCVFVVCKFTRKGMAQEKHNVIMILSLVILFHTYYKFQENRVSLQSLSV